MFLAAVRGSEEKQLPYGPAGNPFGKSMVGEILQSDAVLLVIIPTLQGKETVGKISLHLTLKTTCAWAVPLLRHSSIECLGSAGASK
jgi:hypothetical protein